MPKKPTPKKPATKQRVRKQPVQQEPPINAAAILQMEGARLKLLAKVMPAKSKPLVDAQAWAYELAAAFLESLGAPERLIRYIKAPGNAG